MAQMKETKKTTAPASLFTKDNYMWMIAGIIVMAIGIILMAGGKSNDPNVFKENEVYSTRRITIAPILILLGLGVEVYAIFKKPKTS
jgi:NhaP-type Na+/H+ or K+/H+ antiporter